MPGSENYCEKCGHRFEPDHDVLIVEYVGHGGRKVLPRMRCMARDRFDVRCDCDSPVEDVEPVGWIETLAFGAVVLVAAGVAVLIAVSGG